MEGGDSYCLPLLDDHVSPCLELTFFFSQSRLLFSCESFFLSSTLLLENLPLFLLLRFSFQPLLFVFLSLLLLKS